MDLRKSQMFPSFENGQNTFPADNLFNTQVDRNPRGTLKQLMTKQVFINPEEEFKGNILNCYPDLYKIGAILEEIRYIKMERNNCLVYTSSRDEQVFRTPLKAVLAQFGERIFLQIHRSYCINTQFLVGVIKRGRNWKALCGEIELPISRFFQDSILKVLVQSKHPKYVSMM